MKYWTIILFSLFTFILSQQKDLDEGDKEMEEIDQNSFFIQEDLERINLNSASREDLKMLALTLDQIEEIITYRDYSGHINSINELLSLPSITIVDIHAIRDAVTVEIPEASTFEKVCRLNNEGMSQGEIADELEINKSTVSRHVKRGREERKINLQNV